MQALNLLPHSLDFVTRSFWIVFAEIIIESRDLKNLIVCPYYVNSTVKEILFFQNSLLFLMSHCKLRFSIIVSVDSQQLEIFV